jgi:hypothetical protein
LRFLQTGARASPPMTLVPIGLGWLYVGWDYTKELHMINKILLRSCSLFIAVCCLFMTTNTLAREDAHPKDASTKACLGISSPVFKSVPDGPGALWEGSLMFAQSNSSCPCYSFDKLMSTKWDRCVMASLGFPRMLRRIVGTPPNHEIWTINLHKLSASCQCLSTPAGLCAGKGEGSSEVYHEDMSNSEWMACTDVIKKVAEAQGLTCK